MNFVRRLRKPSSEAIATLSILTGLWAVLFSRLNVSRPWAFGDHTPSAYALTPIISSVTSSWNWTSLGVEGDSGSLYGLITNSAGLGLHFAQIDAFLLMALLPLSGFTTFLLLRVRFSWTISLLSGLFYAMNPVTVAEFIGGEGGVSAGFLALYMFFPIVLWGLIHYSSKSNQRTLRISVPVLVGMGVGLLGSDIPTLVWMYFPPIVLLIVISWLVDEKLFARVWRFGTCLLIGLSPFILLASWRYVLPSGSSAYLNFAAADAHFTYAPASVPNLLRLAGSQAGAQQTLGYNSLTWWGLWGFVPPGLALLGLCYRPGKDPVTKLARLWGGSLMTFGIGLALVVASGDLNGLIRTSATFAALDDIDRIQFWIAIGVTVLLGDGLLHLAALTSLVRTRLRVAPVPEDVTGIIGRFRKVRRPRHLPIAITASSVLLAIAIVLSNFPALDGTLGLEAERGVAYTLSSSVTEVEQLADHGTMDLTHYRMLWIPFDSVNAPGQAWLAQGELNSPYEFGFYSNSSQVVLQVYTAICSYTQMPDLPSLLSQLSVKYVVLDIDAASHSQFVPGTQSACVVQNSSVAIYIETTIGFLEEFQTYEVGLVTLAQTPSVVILSLPAMPLVYAGGPSAYANLPLTPTSPVIEQFGPNLVVDGNPATDSQNWNHWPSPVEFGNASLNGSPAIEVDVGSNGQSVLSQVITISVNSTYEVSYSVSQSASSSRLKVLWFENGSSFGDANAIAINYVPNAQIVAENLTLNFSTELVPPNGSRYAKIELVASELPSQRGSAFALFSNIEMSAYALAANPVSAILPLMCSSAISDMLPTTAVLSVSGCTGTIAIVLNTAFSSDWRLSVDHGNGIVRVHFEANYAFNGWVIANASNLVVTLSVESQPLYTLILSVAVVSACGIPIFFFGVWIVTRLRNRFKLRPALDQDS